VLSSSRWLRALRAQAAGVSAVGQGAGAGALALPIRLDTPGTCVRRAASATRAGRALHAQIG